uniref:STI1-like protein n=2 Tax=Lygus hesperus TaxID=30085 RepID=A0A0A9WPK4_LYGHE
MVKLGKYFLRNKIFDTAITLFDSVIQMEPNFSAAAHYYKAGALGNMINWESMSEKDQENKGKLENEMIQAAKLFEKLGNEAMKNSAIVSKMKCSNKQGIIQIDAYEEQSKNLANLYHLFSQSIGDIFGHAVMPRSFENYSLKDPLTFKVHQYLLRDGILNHSVVSKQNMSQSEVKDLSCGYGVSVSDLNNFLVKWDAKMIKSFRGFKADMKHNLCLPSKEKFWKELIGMDFLSNEVKYVIVDSKKLAEVDPSLLDSLNQISQSQQKHDHLLQENGYLFLNSEQLPNQKTLGNVFLKDEFIELIGRARYLALKNREVIHFNNKCQFKVATTKSENNELACAGECVPQYFDSYDSISIQDFVRNKVSEKEAEIVLQELDDKKIIERRSGANYYRLATHFSQIDNISLTRPVYESITKCLLYNRFAYRIAFQKITSQGDGGHSFQLISKPYLSLFWDLYGSKVICPIKLCKEKHSVDSVRRSLSLTFDEEDFIKWLRSDGSVPCEDSEDLIKQLISKNWLKAKEPSKNEKVAKLDINKLNEKWKPLDQKYGTYEETLKKKLNDLLELSNETTTMHIAHCLERLMSKLDNLVVPSFELKPLKEAVADRGYVSNAEEMHHLISNGLDEILILEEKKYTLRLILSTTVVLCLGICQLAGGIVMDMLSFGTMVMVGSSFISEGISDIWYAINATLSGSFSWADYGKYKMINLVTTMVTTGLTACWSLGKSYLSRVGKKLSGAVATELKTSETVGAQLLRTGKSVGKEIIQQMSLKTLKGIGFGIANLAIDTVVANVLQSLCDEMAQEIMTNVEVEWKSHRITSVLKKACEVMGENDAQALILVSTKSFLEKPSEWERWSNLAGKIFTCVIEYIKGEMAKEGSSGPLTRNFSVVSSDFIDWVVQRLSRAWVWGDRLIHLNEVRKVTEQLLDELSNEIEIRIIDITPVEDQAVPDYERFEKNVINKLKSQIVNKINEILSYKVFDPLLKDVPPTLARYNGRKIKDFYGNFKGGDTELFGEYKRHYEESIVLAGDDVPAIDAVTREYHENVLSLLSKTRNFQLFSDLIRENIPMDMTCLQAFINMLPHILRRLGVQKRIKIVVERYGDDVPQVFASGAEEGVEMVIPLRVKNNYFEVVGRDRTSTRVRELNIIGLFRALSEHLELEMTEDQFRSSTAIVVEEDQEVQSIIKEDWHLNGISLKMHGEAHPYDHDDWSFDPQVDIDLCRGKWVDTESGKKWEELGLTQEELHGQHNEAYRRVLQRINEIVTGRSTNYHWSDCKLIKPLGRIRPHDFKATSYNTVRVTKGPGSLGIALYPVEIKSKIQVEQGESKLECCYEVKIHKEVVSRCERGPHGPHIGYSISCSDGQGPKLVSGHCLINNVGNEHLPHRANEFEKFDGMFHVSDCAIPRIPVRSLFFSPPRDVNRGFQGSTKTKKKKKKDKKIYSRLKIGTINRRQNNRNRLASLPEYLDQALIKGNNV